VRRVIGVVVATALTLALYSAASVAAELPQGIERFDLGSQLMLRVFGETSDTSASFAAAHGDRISESPLRDLALEVHPTGVRPYLAAGIAAVFAQDRFALRALSSNEQLSSFGGVPQFVAEPSVVHFSAPSVSPTDLGLVPSNAHLTAAYQPVVPESPVSPAPGTLEFAPPQMTAPDSISSTTQMGPVQFEGHAEGLTAQTPQLRLPDTSYGAGANFDVRAGKRSLNLNLSSEYEHVTRNDADAFSATPVDASKPWQLPGSGAPLVVPNYADMNRLSLGAGVSVPVMRGLTLHFNYDAQRLYGGYGLPGLMNLDAVNNSYGGKLTFTIPHISNSALSIGAYQDRFQDGILPNNGYTQTREDVNFTVKF
jgi:hypothetical protein